MLSFLILVWLRQVLLVIGLMSLLKSWVLMAMLHLNMLLQVRQTPMLYIILFNYDQWIGYIVVGENLYVNLMFSISNFIPNRKEKQSPLHLKLHSGNRMSKSIYLIS